MLITRCLQRICLALAVLCIATAPVTALDMPSKGFNERKNADTAERESAQATAEGLRQLVIEQRATNDLLRELIAEIRTDRAQLSAQLQQVLQMRAQPEPQAQPEQKMIEIGEPEKAMPEESSSDTEGWEEIR